MLLGHYSGERDVIFGATTAGRPVDLCGVANIVGVFINTLPVRLRLYDSESFLECSKRLQLEQSEAREYDYAPLVRIHDWSGLPGALSLFQSILVFDSYPHSESIGIQAERMGLRRSRIERPVNNYPVTATVRREPNLVLELTFQQQLATSKAEQILEDWRSLLKITAENINLPLVGLWAEVDGLARRSRMDEELFLRRDMQSKLENVRRASIALK